MLDALGVVVGVVVGCNILYFIVFFIFVFMYDLLIARRIDLSSVISDFALFFGVL